MAVTITVRDADGHDRAHTRGVPALVAVAPLASRRPCHQDGCRPRDRSRAAAPRDSRIVARRDRSARHHGRVSAPRRTVILCAVVAAVLVVLGVVVARRFADDGPLTRPDQAQPGTVLLVPGYGGSQAALSQLARRLGTAGRTAQVITLPDGGTGDLRVQADSLEQAVRRELTAGAPSVDLIGYSAGGVVARLWVDRYDGATVARRIVTLGSPLHGTRIAGMGAALVPRSCPEACRQLAPGSDLLDDIDDSDLPEGLPWLSIWTNDDETVQPPDSARLDGAVNVALQEICPRARVSHSALPTDPLVTALVLRSVGPDPLLRPTECPA
ncbi:lipase [Actinoplanes sp. NEAU-A12]|uniref:Lipase n=1 Tax=Actinoplanes sandaracinus TaxID=3045177 RepID=A0ABT6WGA5_9ACTN|nr:lipase [Actinoplanes sandaracinus]MDI6098754.1 lipase [Actinoplanes sandaracinus]